MQPGPHDSADSDAPLHSQAFRPAIQCMPINYQPVAAVMQQDMLAERSHEIVNSLLKEGKRERALLALKKKKLHEKNALQIDNNILLLDERVAALETTAHQSDLMSALKAANGAIKAMQQQMPLDDVEKLLQDNAESAVYVVRAHVQCMYFVCDVACCEGWPCLPES